MINKLISEDQLLDEGFRAAVIEEITGTENVERKRRELRRYEIYRDMTRKWVIESFRDEGLREDTIRSMANRVSNISIAKKVVNKLAQNYTHGVIRSLEDETSQEAIDQLAKLLNFNSKMDKTDKYVQLHKNEITGVVPERDFRESSEEKQRFKLKMKAVPPYLYDAIEDHSDNEQMRVVILTDFVERNQHAIRGITSATDGRLPHLANSSTYSNVPPDSQFEFGQGDRKDQIIADSPSDQGENMRTFIWWSDKYHFTTDENGKVLESMSPEDMLNPIGLMPYVNFTEDQDCEFWAQGGDDLIEGAVLINKLLTDMFSIANFQGWGQMVIKGKNASKMKYEIGPHNAVIFDVDEDDPTPELTFASANPPLDVWMQMVEQYTALLLSTNNLSPRTVSNKLDAQNIGPGIAMLIEKSESTADMKERIKLYQDNEPMLWEIIRRWQALLFERDALNSKFTEVGTFEFSEVNLNFQEPAQIATTKERLEEIKQRKEIGLNTEIELLQIDNPDLTEEEAEQKLLQIKQEKLNRVSQIATQMQNNQTEEPEVEELSAQDQQDEEDENGGEV